MLRKTVRDLANHCWSRSPGKFVNMWTGVPVLQNSILSPGPTFNGSMREWNETLIEIIISAANEIHKKTMRGAGNVLIVGLDVATILENSVAFKGTINLDDKPTKPSTRFGGGEIIGTLNNRFLVVCNPNCYPEDYNKIRVLFCDSDDVVMARSTVIVQDLPDIDSLFPT